MAAACENGAFSDTSLACTSGFTLATYAYDSLSRRTGLTYGNGATMAYIYSNAGDLTDLNHDMSGSGNDPQYDYAYTPAHQLTSMTLSDTDYRWQATGTTTNTYAHNNLNQYTTIDSVTQSYDDNGNLTGNGTWTYAYDAENHMTSASASGTSASYLYDPLDHRSSKLVNSVWTFFLGDTQDDEIAEYSRVSDTDQTPVLLRRFVPGPGIDQPIAMVTAAGARTYFHTNRIGSVIAMSGDSAAKAEGPFSYDPYGFVCQGEGTSTCNLQTGGEPYKFTGRRLDPETGLYYYRARYYSLQLGRFLQTDPIGYQADLNLYTYVGNDPIDRTDPSGLCSAIGATRLNTSPGSVCGGSNDDATLSGSKASRTLAAIMRRLGSSSFLRAGFQLGSDRRDNLESAVIIFAGFACAAAEPCGVGELLILGIVAIAVGHDRVSINKNVNPGDLQKVRTNEEADRVARQHGYRDAHDAKRNRRGDIYVDKKTGRAYVWDGQRTSEPDPL